MCVHMDIVILKTLNTDKHIKFDPSKTLAYKCTTNGCLIDNSEAKIWFSKHLQSDVQTLSLPHDQRNYFFKDLYTHVLLKLIYHKVSIKCIQSHTVHCKLFEMENFCGMQNQIAFP